METPENEEVTENQNEQEVDANKNKEMETTENEEVTENQNEQEVDANKNKEYENPFHSQNIDYKEEKMGTPLYFLLKDLPNNGVGRLLLRGKVEQLPSRPTYMRILEADMTPVKLKMRRPKSTPCISVVVERTEMGITYRHRKNLKFESFSNDFFLVPQEEEDYYLNNSVTAPDYPDGKLHRANKVQMTTIEKLIEEGYSGFEATRIVMDIEKARLASLRKKKKGRAIKKKYRNLEWH
ncbi:uncharacterized protein [Eurosta solidaginis]|uniref:uncharacterized protein n=1 Tax=Eurosta solidaginis TaxID=178769 RepID=UPI003530BCD8